MKNLTFIVLLVLAIFINSCNKEPITTPPGISGTKTITENITTNTVWESKFTYIIENNISVNNDAILTIEPGTIIKFNDGIELGIASTGFGTIKAIGTALKPITFTSNATVKEKGQWDGIWLYDGTTDACEFIYCNIEYAGGYSSSSASLIARNCNFRFDNCSVTNSESRGLALNNGAGFSSFNNNTFSKNALVPVSLYANYVHTLGTANSYASGSVIEVKGDDIEKSGTITWQNQSIPFFIKSDIDLGSSSGTKLILQAGTRIEFDLGIEFEIGVGGVGVIEANGTATNPIIFTSSSQFPSKGDWDGIWFQNNAGPNCILNYCTIEYAGGYGSNYGNVVISQDGGNSNIVDITNCSINHSLHYGISKTSSSPIPNITGTTFSDNVDGDTYGF